VELTEADLPAMALQVDFVDIGAARLWLDPEEGGLLTREEMLEEVWDPEEEAADWEKFGLQAHHDQRFLATSLLVSNVFFACTGLSLYATEEGASADLADSVDEVEDKVGKVSPEGDRMREASTFEVEGMEGPWV
jgi:hypothetical protein